MRSLVNTRQQVASTVHKVPLTRLTAAEQDCAAVATVGSNSSSSRLLSDQPSKCRRHGWAAQVHNILMAAALPLRRLSSCVTSHGCVCRGSASQHKHSVPPFSSTRTCTHQAVSQAAWATLPSCTGNIHRPCPLQPFTTSPLTVVGNYTHSFPIHSCPPPPLHRP